MRFAAWYGIGVGLLMLGQWAFFLAAGHVPEIHTEPLRLYFHLAAESVTALGLIVAGAALLGRRPWAPGVYAVSAGMLLYSVIVSPGYFAQQGQWALAGMFGVLLAFALGSVAHVLRAWRA